jgi:shikimate kinase
MHIILMGFKHVGKSIVGKELARQLHKTFLDVDQALELEYEKKFQEKLSCRQIVQKHGQPFFGDLENQSLQELILLTSAIISLGGATPLSEKNQLLIKPHLLVWVTAPRDVVFARIMATGRPAFFPPEEDPLTVFNRLWEQREKVYRSLADFSIHNDSSLECAVAQILKQLPLIQK